jgi:regulator of CtrA degradation
MQSASWLLVHRAVREGEMTAPEARDPKYRLGARSVCSTTVDALPGLPARLLDLLERSKRIYERIDRIETTLFDPSDQPPENPVNAQLSRLQAALAAGEISG